MQAGQELDQRRLARAVEPDDRRRSGCRDDEVEAPQHLVLAFRVSEMHRPEAHLALGPRLWGASAGQCAPGAREVMLELIDVGQAREHPLEGDVLVGDAPRVHRPEQHQHDHVKRLQAHLVAQGGVGDHEEGACTAGEHHCAENGHRRVDLAQRPPRGLDPLPRMAAVAVHHPGSEAEHAHLLGALRAPGGPVKGVSAAHRLGLHPVGDHLPDDDPPQRPSHRQPHQQQPEPQPPAKRPDHYARQHAAQARADHRGERHRRVGGDPGRERALCELQALERRGILEMGYPNRRADRVHQSLLHLLRQARLDARGEHPLVGAAEQR